MGSRTVIIDEATEAALAALTAALDTIAALSPILPEAVHLEVLRGLESAARRIPALGHNALLKVVKAPDEVFGNQRNRDVIADTLRITRTELGRRISEAEDLAERTSITGQPLAPMREHTAAAQRSGLIGRDHIKVVRDFFRHLPNNVDIGTREAAEQRLAQLAGALRPDELKKAADRLDAHLNPDGHFDDQDRARRRSFHLGKQGPDLMSTGTFTADPELRTYLEALFAKWAKPGMCNPDDESPIADGEPGEVDAAKDRRNTGQRQHDAIKASCRAMLASGELGQHRGLPVTVIVSTTLKELYSLVGSAVTGGGSLLPNRELIRLAAHANHYLAIFDDSDGRPLYLGRSCRIAKPDQRIVMHAQHRGCTYPGCTRPGYLCQCHHCKAWRAQQGNTDADELTFACEFHHPLVGETEKDWTTIPCRTGKYRGRTLWIPPAHIDPQRKPRINHYFHPDEYLLDDDDNAP
ncbi:HNH endonuclease signature motif containing protein [Antrihabitans stalactiti]|uniref:HNH endonuclease n=1 Tax=Antrihabitans stalactiti TaxID=2584121 RepID=A0A848KBN2_9NOCA|nr:HNH endonuclease signature motif containing protein [Antrihabitans stalactiti]NMN94928.1 HNH endonuclease [Antrihabitans stalactiti]